ncbi:MAG: bifunctional 4'-phosphopantothenoylcysteine decarboxylase/phosphopantothenoylcysteine synthetase, partial [Actinobacteria bacterium]|nr:bifunctional 4'-phosphopantothenoylcysteine decarboxylase/phosphopantothenoylcysteine synthetase [Actinomycetota bacterium]
KIKRGESGLQLTLVPNPDILAETAGEDGEKVPLRVGFAAESDRLVERAREKLVRKKLDLIVANQVDSSGSVFGSDLNEVVILDSGGHETEVKLAPKLEVAHQILDQLAKLMNP